MYVYEKIHHVSMSVYCSNHCYCVTMGYTLRLSQHCNVNITYLAEGGVWGMRLLSKFSEGGVRLLSFLYPLVYSQLRCCILCKPLCVGGVHCA